MAKFHELTSKLNKSNNIRSECISILENILLTLSEITEHESDDVDVYNPYAEYSTYCEIMSWDMSFGYPIVCLRHKINKNITRIPLCKEVIEIHESGDRRKLLEFVCNESMKDMKKSIESRIENLRYDAEQLGFEIKKKSAN